MFDSQTISMQGTTATSLWSPWFPRGGDYGIFTMDVTSTSLSGTLKLDVALYTKNSSDVGEPAAAASTTSLSRLVVGRTSLELVTGVGGFTGFKELVRYKFTLSGGSSGTNWLTFRMLPPTWFDRVG